VGGNVHPQFLTLKTITMNTDIQIERYRRYNESEQEVLSVTIRTLKPTIFDKNNTEPIVQQRIKRTKGTTVFLDSDNPNLTATGLHYRKTEIRVANWRKDALVEVKHQKTISNIQESVMAEIARATNIKGQYWLVLLGKAYKSQIVINEFVKMIIKYKLQNKVRMFFDVEDYVLALQQEFL
jgi:hypothetical protein